MCVRNRLLETSTWSESLRNGLFRTETELVSFFRALSIGREIPESIVPKVEICAEQPHFLFSLKPQPYFESPIFFPVKSGRSQAKKCSFCAEQPLGNVPTRRSRTEVTVVRGRSLRRVDELPPFSPLRWSCAVVVCFSPSFMNYYRYFQFRKLDRRLKSEHYDCLLHPPAKLCRFEFYR